MNASERLECARVAKAIDLTVRQLPAAVRPLGVAAVRCLLEIDPVGGIACVVCGMRDRHRCSCPFNAGQLPKWAALQERPA